jgi:hypothetical protein
VARRVFLHIGVPKSGTTFLQTTMWRNRKALHAQGFLYPGRERMDHYHASRQVRGVSPARMGEYAGVWDRLVERLRTWDGDGLISHEFFSMATPKQARAAVRALAPAEVHIVVTARDYLRQLPAVWQEDLKMHSQESFDDFMERMLGPDSTEPGYPLRGAWGWRSQDVPAVLRRWERGVRRSRVHVITVPPPGAPRGVLWERWAQVLGIDDRDFDLTAAVPNASLGAAQAALLQRVKPRLTPPLGDGVAQHRWVRQYFAHEVLVPQRGERVAVRAAHVAAVRERSLQAVESLRGAGYSVCGDLSELVPDSRPPTGAHPEDVPPEELLDVAARAIDQMIHDVRALTQERSEWRALAERRRPFLGRAAGKVAHAVRRRLGPGSAIGHETEQGAEG